MIVDYHKLPETPFIEPAPVTPHPENAPEIRTSFPLTCTHPSLRPSFGWTSCFRYLPVLSAFLSRVYDYHLSFGIPCLHIQTKFFESFALLCFMYLDVSTLGSSATLLPEEKWYELPLLFWENSRMPLLHTKGSRERSRLGSMSADSFPLSRMPFKTSRETPLREGIRLNQRV
jgi:hypothetical protein